MNYWIDFFICVRNVKRWFGVSWVCFVVVWVDEVVDEVLEFFRME